MKEHNDIPIEYLDELAEEDFDETEMDGHEFKPDKPKLTQFIPMLLFCCLFILLGSDFIVRTQIKDKLVAIEELNQPFSVVFLHPKRSLDSTDFKIIEGKLTSNNKLRTKICSDNDSVLLSNTLGGMKIVISDKWTIEPTLHKYRNDPLIQGYILKNKDEKLYDIMLLKWERLKILFLSN